MTQFTHTLTQFTQWHSSHAMTQFTHTVHMTKFTHTLAKFTH